jgi:hypothetical protein
MKQASLRWLLAALGLLMNQAGRYSRAFRRQVTRDVVVEIGSRDGVAHHYVFDGRTRSVASRRGPATEATVSLCFESAGQGFWSLLSPNAVGHIVKATLNRRAVIEGNPLVFLWFYGLTRIVMPINRQRPLRRPLPDHLLAPNPVSRVNTYITREPAVSHLDPNWTNAVEQSRKQTIVRGGDGEPMPAF